MRSAWKRHDRDCHSRRRRDQRECLGTRPYRFHACLSRCGLPHNRSHRPCLSREGEPADRTGTDYRTSLLWLFAPSMLSPWHEHCCGLIEEMQRHPVDCDCSVEGTGDGWGQFCVCPMHMGDRRSPSHPSACCVQSLHGFYAGPLYRSFCSISPSQMHCRTGASLGVVLHSGQPSQARSSQGRSAQCRWSLFNQRGQTKRRGERLRT